MNRSSVREALKKLEQLRLVEIQRGSGARVQDAEHASFEIVPALLGDGRPNPARVRDLLELREVLLPGLLRLALERASDAELEACVAQLCAAPRAVEHSDDEFLADLSRAARSRFARMTHNRVILILAHSVTRFLSERETAGATWRRSARSGASSGRSCSDSRSRSRRATPTPRRAPDAICCAGWRHWPRPRFAPESRRVSESAAGG